MNIISVLSAVFGTSLTSGINLYLTIAGLGIASRYGWVELPGQLDGLASMTVIVLALVLFVIEFAADKIPYVDSLWDAAHTFIRPVGGTVLAYMAMTDAAPSVQIPVALVSGAISLDSHLTKATTRAAINTSPEPVTNSIASVSENMFVVFVLWLVINHPVAAGVVVVLFIIFSIWFLKVMFKFLKKVLAFFKRSKNAEHFDK